MKLATTIGEMYAFCNGNPAEAVRSYVGTGFRHLDYSFYNCTYAGSPFLSDYFMDEVEAAGNAAAECGFDFVQAHAPGANLFGGDTDMVARGVIHSIEACGYLGIRNLVLHQGYSQDYTYPHDKDAYNAANKAFFERLYPAMEKNDVRVLIENTASANMGSMYFPRTGQDMNDFLTLCNHPLLGACWDVGHANMENPDQYGDIVTLGENLCAVHIQDNLGQHDDHIAPFMGTLDIDAVMHGLLDSGFVARGGVFTFEADNFFCNAGGWPNRRNAKFPDGKLASPTKELRREALHLLYCIGKTVLSAYDLFED